MRIGAIYRIWEKDTGRNYIGQSFSLQNRIRSHLRSDMLSVASKNSASLQAAISRRGRDAFAWSPIEWGIPEADINTKEAHYIRFFDSLHPLGFNLVMPRCAPKRDYSLVDGISLDAIDEICKIAESDATTQSLRDASLVRLISECLLRPSEACAIDVDHLRQGGLWVLADDTLLLISDHTIDLIERYRKKGGIEEGSLFRRVRRGDNVQSSRLTPISIKRIIQNWAHRVGIQGNIGGYSVLVGTIGSLLERGASYRDVYLIRNKYSIYLERAIQSNTETATTTADKAELAERGAVARFFYGKKG